MNRKNIRIIECCGNCTFYRTELVILHGICELEEIMDLEEVTYDCMCDSWKGY